VTSFEFNEDFVQKIEAANVAGINSFPIISAKDIISCHDLMKNVHSSGLDETEYTVGGRVMFRNKMGKIVFLRISDNSYHNETLNSNEQAKEPRLQIFIARDAVSNFDSVKSLDIGDIILAKGTLFRTNAGEITLRASSLILAAKTMTPFPDRWNEISEPGKKRYLDLMLDNRSREVAYARANAIKKIRHIMHESDFTEVETPTLHKIPGGANAKPFKTHHNALEQDLCLRVAPELFLKKLVIGGMNKVFEIGKNFRNEGVSKKHNPEFTSIELYAAWWNCEDMMNFISAIMQELLGKTPTVRTMESVVAELIDYKNTRDLDALNEWISLNALGDATSSVAKAWEVIFGEHEKKITDPVFITEFPVELSPLAKQKESDPFVTERFELYMNGMELANGFTELNDPQEQAKRFQEQAKAHASGDEEAMYFDSDYIEALTYGLPPTAGAGIGIDRLIMLMTDSKSIKDVILFPHY
jgi:lysyl-tRNA synthetase class 2